MRINEREAHQIVKMFGGWCDASKRIRPKGVSSIKYEFFNIGIEAIREIRVAFKLGKLEKTYFNGDINFTGENFEFWVTNACKITGYEKVLIPLHEEQRPIYDCKGSPQ